MMEAGRVDKLDQGARRVAMVDAGIQDYRQDCAGGRVVVVGEFGFVG